MDQRTTIPPWRAAVRCLPVLAAGSVKPWPSLGRVPWFPARLGAGLDGDDFLCNAGGYAALTLVAHLMLPAERGGPGGPLAWRTGALAVLMSGIALATLAWLRREAKPAPMDPAGLVRPVE